MIEVRGAAVRIGQRWLFRGLDFELARGEVLAVLGPNGRGKTTLLKAMLGLRELTEGTISIEGSIGYVPQNADVPFAYTVLDMVLMGRARHISFFRSPALADRRLARDALASVGMLHLQDREIDTLSGGERQLVMIARALATECDALLLDEPAATLDFRNQDIILATIDKVARTRDLAVVFTTHSPQHVADKALLIDADATYFGLAGSILAENRLSELYGLAIRRLSFAADDGGGETLAPLYSRSLERHS